MNFEGGCVCGSVRYQLLARPLFIHACHCPHCQTSTGSAFTLTLVSEAGNVRILRGNPEVYDAFEGGSGQMYDINLCGECRTSLWACVHGQSTGLAYVRGGTLDETKELEPAAHIFTRSKQAWVVIPDGVPQFSEGYEAEGLWPEESIARVRALSGP